MNPGASGRNVHDDGSYRWIQERLLCDKLEFRSGLAAMDLNFRRRCLPKRAWRQKEEAVIEDSSLWGTKGCLCLMVCDAVKVCQGAVY